MIPVPSVDHRLFFVFYDNKWLPVLIHVGKRTTRPFATLNGYNISLTKDNNQFLKYKLSKYPNITPDRDSIMTSWYVHALKLVISDWVTEAFGGGFISYLNIKLSKQNFRQACNISLTLVGNKLARCSNNIFYFRLYTWLQWIRQGQLGNLDWRVRICAILVWGSTSKSPPPPPPTHPTHPHLLTFTYFGDYQ